MNITRLCAVALTAGAAVAVAGCTEDYGGYGYARPYGYDRGYYGSPYAYDDYDGYGYGSPYWGWYDNYYYPGVGFYIYDRGGTRYRWNQSQQQYWTSRRGNTYTGQPNWAQFRNHGGTGTYTGRTWDRGGTTGGTYSGRRWNGGGTAGGTYSGRRWNGGGATTGMTGGTSGGGGWGGRHR